MNNKDSIFQCLRIFFPFNPKGQSRQIPILSQDGFTMSSHQQNEPAYHYLRLACEAAKMLRYEKDILLKPFLFYNLGNRLPVRINAYPNSFWKK